MHHNELKHEIKKFLEIIEERDDIFRDIIRHTRNDEGAKQMNIDVLNGDIERLNNLNKEHLNKEYKYKKEIKELKNNLSNEKKVRKKLEKIYEDLKNDNDNLLFELDGIKMINKILKEDNYKYNQKIKEIEKELKEGEEYINIDAKIKDKAQKYINELNTLNNTHEQEIKNLKDQLNLKDKSDQEPKSRKRADQEPKSRKKDDHQGKGYVNLPILLSKLNINSSKELIDNIKQLINNLYDNEKITKQVYNNLIKAITYKNDS